MYVSNSYASFTANSNLHLNVLFGETYCLPWSLFLNIKEILEQSDAGIENAEITMLPTNSVELGDEDSEKVIRLIDTLEDLDDVQNVYTNAELSEASVT